MPQFLQRQRNLIKNVNSAQGLVGYWPLNEESDVVRDQSPTNSCFGKIDGQANWNKGKFGNCFYFANQETNIFFNMSQTILSTFKNTNGLQTTSNLFTTGWSLACWVYVTSTPSVDFQWVYYIGDNGQQNNQLGNIGFGFLPDGATLVVCAEFEYINTFNTLSNGWHHLVLSFSTYQYYNNNGLVYIYVDGNFVSAYAQADFANVGLTPQFFLGGLIYAGDYSGLNRRLNNVLMCEARIYNFALNPQQIKILFTTNPNENQP